MKPFFFKDPSRRFRFVGLVIFLLVFTWPLVLSPFELIGHPLGEANNHFWMFWRAGQGAVVSNYPVGVSFTLMDPVNWPVFALFARLDPALGYNAVFVFNLCLAFLGASLLARSLGVSRGASFSAGVACCCSPFLAGLGSFGITEAWPIGWLGIHCALVLTWSKSGRLLHLVGAGLALVAFLYSGWYHAVFVLMVEVGFLAWFLSRSEKQKAALFSLQALVAGLCVLPVFVRFLGQRDFWQGRWHGVPSESLPYWSEWREVPRTGADGVNLFLPSFSSVSVSNSVYLGLVVLLLCVWAGKRARLLLAAAGFFVILSLGYRLTLMGHQTFWGGSVLLPAAWLTWVFDPLEGLTHWYRALGPAVLFLAVAASMGVERLAQRRPVWLLLAPVLILADSLWLSQTPWPRDQISVVPPRVYEHVDRGGGAVLQIPLHNQRRDFSDDVPRVHNLWQPLHGLVVAENYEGVDAVLDKREGVFNPFVDEMQRMCLSDGVDGMPEQAQFLLDTEQRKMWLAELVKRGFVHIVVHGVGDRQHMDAWQCGRFGAEREVRQQVADRLVSVLGGLLGEPVFEAGGDVLFRLQVPARN